MALPPPPKQEESHSMWTSFDEPNEPKRKTILLNGSKTQKEGDDD